MAKPVYVFSGFLDAGKTTVIKETLYDPSFNEGESTLVVAFERGDVIYDEKFNKITYTSVEYLDSINDFTLAKQKELNKKYKPERVIIELNGMEDDGILYRTGFIKEWELAQTLSVFDASKFKLYINNMKQFVLYHVVNAECCIFNRIEGADKRYLRNNLKAINQQLEIIYVDKDGNASNKIEDELFDVSKDLDISDIDYGLWYMDALDHPDKYDGKTITLKVKFAGKHPQKGVCIMGRKAMVCCSEDITDIALTVVNIHDIDESKYYRVTGKIRTMDSDDGYKTCVLFAEKYEEAEAPADELVYFN